jgi:coatomer protein complex subunit alpha (xenin)
VPAGLGQLEAKLKEAYQQFGKGQFKEAHKSFLAVLHQLLFVTLEDKRDIPDAMELLQKTREYTHGVRMELLRRDEAADKSADPVRQLELACYFTSVDLQPVHVPLVLNSATVVSYNKKNAKLAGQMAKRLLESNPSAAQTQTAKKVLTKAEGASDAHEIDYDPKQPFVVCGKSLKPIYRSQDRVRCAFCLHPYRTQYKGETCAVCEIGQIGGTGAGIVWSIACMH